jgi:transposase
MSSDARPTTTDDRIAESLSALPDDPAILRNMIAELLEALKAARHENEQLTHRLDLLLRRLYGPRTERFDPNQLLLIGDAFEPVIEPPAVSEPPPRPAQSSPPKPGHGRKKLPANLPRVQVVHKLSETERHCPECGELRAPVSAETSEQLDYKPASLFVVEHTRLTYACRHCEGQLVTAPKPPQPIDRGLPGPGLLSHIATSKYKHHIPLYRLEPMLKREGVELSRSTICDWMGATAEQLKPLYGLLKSRVLLSSVIHTDDTKVNVRDAEQKIKAEGRLWAYLGDHTQRYTVFDFTMSHSRDGPIRFLGGFHGYLQADAFSGYDRIYAGGEVIEVGCNAHARRKFVEAQKSDATRASAALGYYHELYAIEKAIKGELDKLPTDAAESEHAAIRLRIRQEKSVPVIGQFSEWLLAQKAIALPKSPIGGAIGYVVNQWAALTRYANSGYLSIDNNVAEQRMKAVATGRKNWLFVGSERGGETMAVILSVLSSCERHGHDPFVYLRDVLTRLPGLAPERLVELLPDRWSLSESGAAVQAETSRGGESVK